MLIIIINIQFYIMRDAYLSSQLKNKKFVDILCYRYYTLFFYFYFPLITFYHYRLHLFSFTITISKIMCHFHAIDHNVWLLLPF